MKIEIRKENDKTFLVIKAVDLLDALIQHPEFEKKIQEIINKQHIEIEIK